MLPAEHPDCEHRNVIGLQRAATIAKMGRQAAFLYKDGYNEEGDDMLDKITEQREKWKAPDGEV